MAFVQPLVLVNSANAKWTTTQEKSINRDYPFTDLHLESPEQYVVRTYLQFLWLPESIMPLILLVPSLRRVQEPPSSSESEHPLHALLEPLLLSTRSSSSKYHTELPQILANNGGAGEIEETTMWYALNYEKAGAGEGGEGENGAQGSNSEDAVIIEDKWKNAWLERLERREVQIQILLYLLKLSLPGPCRPLPPVTIPPSGTGNDTKLAKNAKRRKEKSVTVTPSPTERLESFMDKLSTWQLISKMDSQGMHGASSEERDWMQTFCEDVVEPQFKTTFPDMCEILRSKVFPHSPFADDDYGSNTDVASNRSSSPAPVSKPSTSKTSREKEGPKQNLHRSASVSSTTAGSDLGARSRSLSVSLAQDASTRRSNSATSTTLKRALSREIPSHRLAPNAKKRVMNAQGVTLVAATPTKSGPGKRSRSAGVGLIRNPSPIPILNMEIGDREVDPFEVQDEEIWLPDSSPDLLLLRAREHSSSSSSCLDSFNNQDDDGDDDSDIEMQTPVKKRLRL
ncbi:hypothetical protein F5J12DRAFT_803771 [Pisolithus orientalis]|uniref:uncharacterized protein n=1 Tax=Pisolithus orientalis TaxID=936130 RepID=UPI002224CE5C|nr:uncharacterized protein F5J12DRAFT_803771 [Pisolithus orientalis]KAI6030901.1 hypothetical protein F5J12DRAFT_803771 [Pisolithus orientalis]